MSCNDQPPARLRLTGGQATVMYLSSQYSERDGVRRRAIGGVLGIPGHGNVAGVIQALEQDDGTMPYFQAKNEQAMVHAAIGYARANDRLATLACSASIGPGSTNMVTGAATATVDRIPVLLLPSDTFATRLQGVPMQSLDDPTDGERTVNDCLRPVSRYFDRVARPEQLLDALRRSVQVLLDPEHTGAVTVCIHQDVQGEAYDFPAAFFEERTWRVSRRPPAIEDIERASEALTNAQRPVIVAGGGVHYSGASAALRELADALSAPVAETSAGKGALSDHALAVGAIGHSGTRAANTLARQADLVVCVGTRLIDLTTGSNTLFENPEVRFVLVNIASADAHKLRGVAVVADAKLGIEALTTAIRDRRSSKDTSWQETVAKAKADWKAALDADLAPRPGERMSQGQVLRVLNEYSGPEDVLVVASGTPHVDVHKLWDTSRGTRVMMEVGFSCMGHEIPAALGVRLSGCVAGEVYAVIGDGTYLMGNSELLTAVQEHLKITVLVVENHGFQSIHALQRDRVAHSFGLEFRERGNSGRNRLDGEYVRFDIAANARSYGVTAHTAESPLEFHRALQLCSRESGPCVIVARVEPRRLLLSSECWWDVGVPQVARDPETLAAARASESGRSLQRFLG
jgi:3D-(3,5/4)-trihydroxycyclohexane-1,2-dione acylhydrolase (decyclizing)